jgi:DNA/RNA endonuclease YhcR with UshA esterase domain
MKVLFLFRTIFLLAIVFATLVVFFCLKLSAKVFINEFIPDPEGSDSGKEWVELYNDSSESIDLKNWVISTVSESGNVRNTFISEQIEPNSLFLVVENENLYAGTNKVVVGDGKLNLYNTGKQIQLKNSTGDLIDQLEYSNVVSGKSFERRGPLCSEIDKHLASNTMGEENSNILNSCWQSDPPIEEPITIDAIEFSLDQIEWGSSVNVIAGSEVYLRYKLNRYDALIDSTTWSLEDGTLINNPTNLSNFINKRIKLTLTTEGKALEALSEPINIFPKLQITEFLPNPRDSEKQWIEIYNPNDFVIDLTSYNLKTKADVTISLTHELYANGSSACGLIKNLAAKSYCIVTLNENLLKITSEEEVIDTLTLFANELFITDVSYTYTLLDQSFSLYENIWRDDLEITPGAENKLKEAKVVLNTLQISEIYPTPNSSKSEVEWLELFNYGAESINLNSWYLKEIGSGEDGFSSSFSYLPNIVLEPFSHYVIHDPDLFITLNNSGDTIYLFNPQNELIDTFKYSSITTGNSASRVFSEDTLQYLLDYSTSENFVPISSIPTPNNFNQFPLSESIKYFSISDARSLVDGKVVGIEGVVCVEVDILGNSIFYLQDFTSGIRVYLESDVSYQPRPGQVLRVEGKLETSRGERRIVIKDNSSINEKDENGNALGNRNVVINDLSIKSWEELEGNLIKIYGEIVNNYSTSFDVNTINGVIRVSILSSTGINLPEKSKGDWVEIIGFVSQYDTLYRILPRYESDIIIFEQEESEPIKSSIASSTKSKTSTPKSSKVLSEDVVKSDSNPISKLPNSTIYPLENSTVEKDREIPLKPFFLSISIVLLLLIFKELKSHSTVYEYINYLKNKFYTYLLKNSNLQLFESTTPKVEQLGGKWEEMEKWV